MLRFASLALALTNILSIFGCSNSSSGSDPVDAAIRETGIGVVTNADSSGGDGRHVGIDASHLRPIDASSDSSLKDRFGGNDNDAGDTGPDVNTTDVRLIDSSFDDAGGCTHDSGCNTLTGTVLDALTTDSVSGLIIEALDNDTGEHLDIGTVSGTDGGFTLSGLPDGLVGLLVMGTQADATGAPRIDVYIFNVPSDAQDRVVMSSTISLQHLLQNMLGISQDESKATVIGSVYYFDDDSIERPVDCAVVTIDRPGDVYYYEETRLPSLDRDNTASEGRFLLTNTTVIPAQNLTITASVDGRTIGSTIIPLMDPRDSVFSENLHVVQIYADELGDPTPDCR